jgi:hypothetical protein
MSETITFNLKEFKAFLKELKDRDSGGDCSPFEYYITEYKVFGNGHVWWLYSAQDYAHVRHPAHTSELKLKGIIKKEGG